MPNLKTFIPVPENSDFTIHNLPYGIFSDNRKPRIGVAIGEQILDLAAVARLGHFDKIVKDRKIFQQDTLNDFIALGKIKTKAVRDKITKLLSNPRSPLKKNKRVFVKQDRATMHMPVKVGDYTDFYSSIEHATNVGMMFRDPKNALLPNWRHLPIGYHGRASSIVVSGTPLHRPKGQVMPKNAKTPVYQASARVDFELEMGFIIGKANALGTTVSTKKAEEHIFGMVIFNDWSARDIQKWEYVPLGPFLGKSFGSSISPWVVPMEALDPFRTRGPKQDPKVLPYLKYSGKQNYDIKLEVGITPKKGKETIVCRSNFKYMYWNMLQQLAHHTINGCNMNVGDILASGTISGKDETSYGSMLELSWAGSKKINLEDGSDRVFIKDHDTVTMRAFAKNKEIRVGFGAVSGTILPAKK